MFFPPSLTINGGVGGFNALVWDNINDLDFSLGGRHPTNISAIDLGILSTIAGETNAAHGKSNTLTLDAKAVLDMTPSVDHTLHVFGETGGAVIDKVHFADTGGGGAFYRWIWI